MVTSRLIIGSVPLTVITPPAAPVKVIATGPLGSPAEVHSLSVQEGLPLALWLNAALSAS